MAERFGGGPFMYEDVDIVRRSRLLTVLGVEGQIARDYQDADVLYREPGWEQDED